MMSSSSTKFVYGLTSITCLIMLSFLLEALMCLMVKVQEILHGIIKYKLPTTLLETLIKNCGEVVHMHVAERDELQEMIRLVKKKHPDFQVKEKVLTLIDTWQEAFGGPRARYPQYYIAYQELLRLGAVFPQRSESSVPIFTPPQTQPLSSYPKSIRSPNYQQEAPEYSATSEYPTLSVTKIQNAREIMDVLAEMLNALDPGNREVSRNSTLNFPFAKFQPLSK